MTYGEKIAQLRKNANLTQAGLGDQLGVTAQAVSKWEHDASEPDLGTLKKIADLFGISIDNFLDTNQVVEPIVPVNPKEVAAEMAPVVADTVATSVRQEMDGTIDEVKSAVKSASDEVLGHCVECGTTVRKDNKGCTSPRVLCSKCYAKQKAQQKAEQEKEEQAKTEAQEALASKRNKCLFWGVVTAIVAVIITIAVVVKNQWDVGVRVGVAFAGLWVAYALMGTIVEVFLSDSAVSNIMEWCLTRSIQWPGVIFTWDMGGFLFLITIKLLFAIIGFLVGAFFFAIGLALSMVVSTFSFPFTLRKVNQKIKGELPVEQEDLNGGLL